MKKVIEMLIDAQQNSLAIQLSFMLIIAIILILSSSFLGVLAVKVIFN